MHAFWLIELSNKLTLIKKKIVTYVLIWDMKTLKGEVLTNW